MIKKYDCIFLDRDGTINHDPGYVASLKEFQFYSYAFEALKILSSVANYFVIITNQSGIARGLIKKNDLADINNFIQEQFYKNELNLLGIYSCFDDPRNPSQRRKPGLGMFIEASNDHNINLSKCIMIGDSYKDIIPAFNLGMDSMLVLTGNGKNDQNKFDKIKKPNFVVKNLLFGAKALIR